MADNKVKVLYIAGLGRSGSTILGNILGEIEGFFHGGEFNFIWERNLIENRLCGCGAPFDECGVWGSVMKRAFGGMAGVDAHEMVRSQASVTRTRHIPLMFFSRGRRMLASRLDEYLIRLQKLYRAVQATTGSQVIVDSSKFPTYGCVLEMTPGIDLYVVHLVRDSRAVAYSWLRKKPQPDIDEPTYMHQMDTIDSSLLWDVWNASCEALWRSSSGRYMRLRYEDFVEEPQRTLKNILGMLHEDTPRLAFIGERAAELRISHTVSGNPNRFQTGMVRLRSDEEWVSQMGLGDKILVTLLTLPLLARYGYPIAPVNWLER